MQKKSIFQLSTIARLSLGLIAMAISLFLIADMIFGILPNQEKIDQENRKYFAENLAIQLISLIEENNNKALNKTIQQIVLKHPEVISIGVRNTDGGLKVRSHNHEKHWQLSSTTASTLNNFRVPIYSKNNLWGNIEINFKPRAPTSLIDWAFQSKLIWLSIAALLSAAVVYAYLSRAMHYLDPSKAVPSRVHKAFDIIADGILVLDKKGLIVLANDAFKKLATVETKDLVGKKTSELALTKPLLKSFPNGALPWESTSIADAAVTDVSLDTTNSENTPLSLLVSSIPISDNDKVAKGFLVTFKNISELHKTNQKLNKTLDELNASRAELEANNQQLQEMAYRDSLTGCLNRRAFFQKAEDLFSSANQGNRELFCIMADIDFFKSFNDIYGHYIGDQVIQVVAKTFTSCLRPFDLVCRYGGEEFCMLISDLSKKEVHDVCERIRKTIEETANKSIRNTNIKQITVSFGIASINSGANSIENLIDYADNALYMSKESGRNRITHWATSLLN